MLSMTLNLIKISMRIIYIALSVTLFIANSFASCPVADDQQHQTVNSYGLSSYTNNFSLEFIEKLDSSFEINKNSPVLDIGSGLGEFSYNSLKAGVTKIYVNDMDEQNMLCLKNNLNKTFPRNTNNITYITGSFIEEDVASKVPDNSMGFIHAKNVIHFFTFEEMFKFTEISNRKLRKDGFLFIVFENKYLDEQRKLIDLINKQLEASKSNNLNDQNHIIENAYNSYSMGDHNYKCSSKTFSETPNEIKLIGFPCQINRSEQNSNAYPAFKHYQLIIPEILANLLEIKGFKNIKLAEVSNSRMFIVLAQKA
jgi:SAM-dependent methyltransferase